MSVDADKVFSAQLAAETIARTDKLGKENVEMALQLKQAREFMEWSLHHMRTQWLDWVDESKKVSQDFNLFRMSMQREGAFILAAGKDVKDFFTATEYVVAHERLKELIGLLDRFESLKKSGTLDAFADFILKVECK